MPPLVLTEEQRRRIANRLMLQAPPTDFEPIDPRRRIEGMPEDVLFALEAVALLAEQGNKAAKWLYWRECERLGITFPTRFGT